METVNRYLDWIDKKTKDIEFVVSLEKKTKVRRAYLVVAAAALLLVVFVLLMGFSFVANLIGVVYPVYCSLLAIESHDEKDDTKWLIYWVVFGFLNIVESIVTFFARLNGLYYVMKVILLVCCFIPEVDLAGIIYKECLEPFLNKNESKIDSTVDKLKEKVQSTIKEVEKKMN